jgi:hypothetical protein
MVEQSIALMQPDRMGDERHLAVAASFRYVRGSHRFITLTSLMTLLLRVCCHLFLLCVCLCADWAWQNEHALAERLVDPVAGVFDDVYWSVVEVRPGSFCLLDASIASLSPSFSGICLTWCVSGRRGPVCGDRRKHDQGLPHARARDRAV